MEDGIRIRIRREHRGFLERADALEPLLARVDRGMWPEPSLRRIAVFVRYLTAILAGHYQAEGDPTLDDVLPCLACVREALGQDDGSPRPSEAVERTRHLIARLRQHVASKGDSNRAPDHRA